MSLQVKFAFRKGAVRVTPPLPRPSASPSPSSSSSSSIPLGELPLAPVCRTYRCHRCTFHTNQAKLFLFHQRDEHGDLITIYPCDKCEYASKYKNKLYRHHKLVHKHKFVASELPSGVELDDSQTQGSSASSVMNGVDSPDDIIDTDSRNENDVLGETEVGFDSEMNFEADGDLGYENGEDVVNNTMDADSMVVDDETIEMMEEEEDKECEGGLEPDEARPDPTENAYDYIVSTSTVHSPPLFQCRLCTYVNAHKWKIANHIRNTHMKKTLFKCPYCEFVCSRKIEWCIHKTRHTNKTVYSCKECFYRTTMKRNFDRHLSRHRIRGPIKCAMCSYSSTGEAAIQRHMAEYHTSPEKSDQESPRPVVVKPVKRPAMTGSRRLMKIMRTSSHRDVGSSESRSITCSLCGQVLHSEAKLRVHMASHSDVVSYECPMCPLRYKDIADLHAHLKDKHDVEASDIACLNLTSGGDGSNTDEVDQDEPLNLSVKESSEIGEPVEAISESTFELGEESSEGVQQDEPLDLSVTHSRRVLFQPEILKCSHCSYIAKWQSDLHRHMLVHSIEKRFKCRYCGKKYKYRFDLNMHLRKTHKIPAGRNRKTGSAAMHHADSMAYFASSGARRAREMDEVDSLGKSVTYVSNRHPVTPGLKCKHCPYVGKYKAEVERHMRLHSGKKPWCCIHCSYKTYWKGDMKRHLQKHHPAEVKAIGNVFDLLAETFVTYEDSTKTDVQADASDNLTSTVMLEMTEGDIHVKTEPIDDYTEMTVDQNEALGDMAECAQDTGETDVLCKKFCKCPLCAFVCEAPSKLKCHMEIHDNLKRFMCPTCGKRSNWLWDVRKHIRKEHQGASMEVTVLSEVEALATLEEYFATHSMASARSSPIKPDGTDGTGDDSASNASFDTSLMKSPKQPGYGIRCRPYKCSMCGRRSNWKWDLNKHIKTVHPGATVIVLSEEEARATLHEVMPYTKPRKADAPRDVPVANDVSPRSSQSSVLKQLTAMRCRPFKCSRCGQRSNWKWDIKKHIRMNHASAHVIILSEQEAIATVGDIVNKSHGYNRSVTSDSPGLKRFRCPLCEYQANYRSDVLRHLRRVHKCSDAQVIMQNVREVAPMKVPKSLLETYMTAKVELDTTLSPQVDITATTGVAPLDMTVTDGALSQKLWRCSKCNFRDRNKGVVVHHYRTHSYGTAFACRICGDTSDYRNSIYRHIRNKHQRDDYTEIIVETALHSEKVNTDDSIAAKSPMLTKHDMLMLPQSSKLYRCHDCGVTSGYKSVIVQHCKTEHHSNSAEDTIQEIYTSSPIKSSNDISVSSPTKPVLTVPVVRRRSPISSSQASDPKPLHCSLCPYKTNKTGLLKLHSSYHKPQSGNNFKCKYCPYYVCAMRLLHQHMRLHLAEQGIIKDEEDGTVVPSITGAPIVKVMSFSPAKSPTKSPRTKYYCDKCPYSSTNKNDSLYHKQFHRPRAAAPYKCDHCPYWVTYRRLLSQHTKVHFRQVEPQPDAPSTRDDMSSIEASPCKSDTSVSDYLTEDVVKVAHIKQKIIASKITRVPITPEKLQQLDMPQPPSSNSMLVPGYIVNRRGHLMLSGSYRKLHRCRFCPYTNVRGVNLRLHEKMHGYRGISSVTGKELLKCPYCDYHVANKGLLTHHVKVHSHQYRPGIDEINDTEKIGSDNEDNEDDTFSMSTTSKTEVKSPQLNVKDLPKNVAYYVKYDDNTGEHILERVLTKKWSCEKCPYVSGKKAQFERHVLLHGSKQKYLCEYCDYSVPAYQLLVEHRKLHLKPNPNLLSVQSILNLQQLPEVPADVAAAANFTGSSAGSESNSVNGDELNLYENSSQFKEPKKLYRCDRCPYTNVRRDYLLTHLKFHMTRSELTCPYCDYSVHQPNLLNQHIRVHFTHQDGDNTLPEKVINEHLVEKEQISKVDVSTAVDTAESSNPAIEDSGDVKTEENKRDGAEVKKEVDVEGQDKVEDMAKEDCDTISDKVDTVWVCEYCDRVFDASEKLMRHEMQHLMGNQF